LLTPLKESIDVNRWKKKKSLWYIEVSKIEPSECAEVAQLVEHSPEKAGVRSSILRLGTRKYLLQVYFSIFA
jgi:hypothetical protein